MRDCAWPNDYERKYAKECMLFRSTFRGCSIRVNNVDSLFSDKGKSSKCNTTVWQQFIGYWIFPTLLGIFSRGTVKYKGHYVGLLLYYITGIFLLIVLDNIYLSNACLSFQIYICYANSCYPTFAPYLLLLNG